MGRVYKNAKRIQESFSYALCLVRNLEDVMDYEIAICLYMTGGVEKVGIF